MKKSKSKTNVYYTSRTCIKSTEYCGGILIIHYYETKLSNGKDGLIIRLIAASPVADTDSIKRLANIIKNINGAITVEKVSNPVISEVIVPVSVSKVNVVTPTWKTMNNISRKLEECVGILFQSIKD